MKTEPSETSGATHAPELDNLACEIATEFCGRTFCQEDDVPRYLAMTIGKHLSAPWKLMLEENNRLAKERSEFALKWARAEDRVTVLELEKQQLITSLHEKQTEMDDKVDRLKRRSMDALRPDGRAEP